MSTEPLSTPLQFLKGVGPRRAADLERIGLRTVEDLLYRFPIRYEDRSHLQAIASLRPGPPVSVTGRVSSCGLRATRRPGFKIFEALVTDPSGSIRATWLNQPFLRDVFASGQQVVLFGPVEMRGTGWTAAHQPAVRDSRRRGRGDDPYRPDRSRLREDRQRHHQDPATARLRGAAAASRGTARPVARAGSRAARPSVAAGGAARRAFSTRRRPARELESIRHPGAAPADLRRGVSLSDRRGRAAPRHDG